ncbi:MAG: beta-ketoacyl synthase chain length factor [Myxococcaceae bacterium]
MRVFITAAVSIVPPAGAAKVEKIGEEDARTKRLPRVDRMALSAGKQALAASGGSTEGMALMVGTNYGGLQATVDFLEGMAAKGFPFASPSAFHESVHHAPAGQLSIALQLTGPSLTCTDRELSGETALKAGADLIVLGRAKRALVVSADEVVPAFEEAFRAHKFEYLPREGAAALVLAESGPVRIEKLELDGPGLGMLRAAGPVAEEGFIPSSGGLIAVARAFEKLKDAPAGERITLERFAFGGSTASITLVREA